GTATIKITAVNDQPTFTGGPDLTVDEDAGPVTSAGWATNVLPYLPAPTPVAIDEATQMLSFHFALVSSTGSFTGALVSAGPAIVFNAGTNSWDLTFTTALNANGTAT